MIKKLCSQDMAAVMDFLKIEPEYNIFIIGDIENYGFENDMVGTWGDYDEKGNIIAVLQRYYNNFVVYAKESNNFDVRGFAGIVLADVRHEILSGKSETVKRFKGLPEFNNNNYVTRELYFAKLKWSLSNAKSFKVPYTSIVKVATEDDAAKIASLYRIITEFRHTGNEDMISKNIKKGNGRYYFIEKEDKTISVAATSGENSLSAMIVGVATHPAYRRMGLASACMTKLCQDLVSEGRGVCLFYDNPEAGRIYKKLGFEDMGMWCIMEKAN